MHIMCFLNEFNVEMRVKTVTDGKGAEREVKVYNLRHKGAMHPVELRRLYSVTDIYANEIGRRFIAQQGIVFFPADVITMPTATILSSSPEIKDITEAQNDFARIITEKHIEALAGYDKHISALEKFHEKRQQDRKNVNKHYDEPKGEPLESMLKIRGLLRAKIKQLQQDIAAGKYEKNVFENPARCPWSQIIYTYRAPLGLNEYETPPVTGTNNATRRL